MYQSVMKTMKILHDLESNTESKSASEIFHAVYYFFKLPHVHTFKALILSSDNLSLSVCKVVISVC